MQAKPSRLLYFNARNTLFLLPDRSLSFEQTPYELWVPVRYFSGGGTRADFSSRISPLFEQRLNGHISTRDSVAPKNVTIPPFSPTLAIANMDGHRYGASTSLSDTHNAANYVCTFDTSDIRRIVRVHEKIALSIFFQS
jgi:hypothetical protein